jgi:hypothetical protein
VDATQKLARAYRAVLVLGLLVVGLGVACVGLARKLRASGGGDDGGSTSGGGGENSALFDPELRRQALDELVKRGAGVWDTFPDATVARVLQPGLKGRPFESITIDSDELGLRERSFQLPKPAGTTRVVLLGDSFVMGYGVKAEDRIGVFLEKLLAQQSKAQHGPIECLHFGINAWNVVSECAFLRRQLSLAQPDLVVQIAVRNDLEDVPGARGMGTLSNGWPRFPDRPEGVFFAETPRFSFGTRENSWLQFALDWEGRSRFEEAGRAVGELARDVAKTGGRYLLFDSYAGLLDVAQKNLASELAPEQSVVFPTSFNRDDRYRNSKADSHWNRAGHEQAALFLFDVVQSRGLLPKLALEALPAAHEVGSKLLAEAENEVAHPKSFDKLLERRKIDASIDFRRIDDDHAAQVHGGVVKGGLVAPYASMILRCEGRKRLVVEGRGLARPELDGVKVALFVDGKQVGSLEPRSGAGGATSATPTPGSGAPFRVTADVPDELAKQTFVSVRLQADDFVYDLPDLRSCRVCVLDRVALE